MDENTINCDVTIRDAGPASSLGMIDQYELVRELGGGGFGTVYLARDTVAGVEVAVKGLPPLVRNNREELENIRQNFALVSRLHHPNIAAALHLHLAKNATYRDAKTAAGLNVQAGDTLLVIQYAPGVTLSQWRKQFPGGRLPSETAVEIVSQIADALDYAHGQGIIHRDVKPSNVIIEQLVGGKLVAHVLDFGLAAQVRTSMSRVSMEVCSKAGTRPYMAPEQWNGERQGVETDQYALAVLFYELITGEVPFASAFETGDPAVMLSAVNGREPDWEGLSPFEKTLGRALAKKRSERFPSCRAFADALKGKPCEPSKPAAVGPKAQGATGPNVPKLALIGIAAAGVMALAIRSCSSGTPVASPRNAPWESTGPTDVRTPEERALEAFRAGAFEDGWRIAVTTEKTHPKLQCYIGMCYDQQEPMTKGVRVRKDDWTARDWYQKSAQQGDPRAMTRLGLFLEKGRAGDVDREKALRFYKLAADRGFADGAANLKRLESELAKERSRQEQIEADQAREQSEKAALEEKRKKGYTIKQDWRGQLSAVWEAGQAHEDHPHWITGTKEGAWRPEDGYVKVNADDGVFAPLVWRSGLYKGSRKDVKSSDTEGVWLQRMTCSGCHGAKKISSSATCASCNGTGKVGRQESCRACSGSGVRTVSSRCAACRGSGSVKGRCYSCGGNGRITCSGCGGRGSVTNPGAVIGGIIGGIASMKKGGRGFAAPTQTTMRCPNCSGRGYASCSSCRGSGSATSSCQSCNGRGTVSYSQTCSSCDGNPTKVVSVNCLNCRGRGRTDESVNCPTCHGDGYVWQ